jgi:hypothetical protein
VLVFARCPTAALDRSPGDDALTVASKGVDRAKLRILAGDGNDRIRISAQHRDPLAKDPPPSDLSALSVVAQLGAGDDTRELFSYAYRSILTDIDTGPFGDGVDFVTGSHTAYAAVQPVRKVIRRIDRGADLALWITVGFFEVVEDSHPSSTRQIVRLLAR